MEWCNTLLTPLPVLYFLGGGSLNKQKEAAENKFKSLEEEFNFFHENVFKIEDIEDSKEFNHDYEPGSDDRNNNFNLFYGVWTTFTPKLLAWDPPFMAGVETNGDGGDFFKTIIGSYLGREPSVEECKEFRRDERWKNIKELHGDAYPISLPDNIPESEPDNGC